MADRDPGYIARWLGENLHRFDNPSQMLGTEPGAARKPWDSVKVRWLVAASWPYYHSTGNQSIPAVCATINNGREDFYADRFYLPETPRDLRQLERAGIPAFGIESKRQLRDFDVVGTSISYAVLWLNFCKLLKISGIPLRWRDRQERAGDYPMVVAGGQACRGPGFMEPVADCVFLGEVEDEPGNGGLSQVCARIAQFKDEGAWQVDRIGCYERLAREFNYLFFPRFVETFYRHEDRGLPELSRQVSGYRSLLDGMRMPFRARTVKNLDNIAPLTEAPLLYADPRMGAGDIEVGRGCDAWCSFPLAPDELIVTREGVVPIGSLDEDCVEVWTAEGWRKAEVQDHGRQPVQRITFAPALPNGPSKTETCEFGHPRTDVSPRGRCRICQRIYDQNRRYLKTGRPEKVVRLEPVPGWERYPRGGWQLASRSNFRQTVTATPRHGWELVDGTETHDLKIGDVVRSCAVQPDFSSLDYKRGWLHGMVFGDGSKAGGRHRRGYRIRLHGEKDQEHLWRFEEARKWDRLVCGIHVVSITYPHHPTSPDGEPAVWIASDIELKEFPSESYELESPDYLAGFLDGWLAADSTGKSSADDQDVRCLSSQSADARAWLDRYAAISGWLLTGQAVSNRPTNFGERSAPMNIFTLVRNLDRAWKVTSIEPLLARPEVYCLSVPGVRRFTLAAGIMTGNCALGWNANPPRERSVGKSVAHAKAWQRNMGSTELSPFSPDFPMHRQKKRLLKELLENVNSSLDVTAMRIDDFIEDDQYMLIQARAGADGVTLGLEGNSQRMRDLVGKGVADKDVEEAVIRGIRAGFRKFKLFMITNFPGEEPGDVMKIVELGRRLAAIRDELGQPHVVYQFSWTPLLIESQTPFQWFAPTPPDHTLIKVAEEFRDLNIQFKVGTKAEINKVSLFQLCQRASRGVGEAITDVIEELDTACWGGVPKDTRDRLEAAMRRRGFRNGLADCFDERFAGDLFGWEYISMGVSFERMWDAYRQMTEFLEGTDAETYESQFAGPAGGNEWVARCDQQCGGNACGVCDGEDLKLRAARIRAGDADIDLARVKVIDQDSVALKVRARIVVPPENRFVTREHWKYAIRRAAYRAQHDLDWKTGIAKKTVQLASDACRHRDWACGTDYAEFGLTWRPPYAELYAFMQNTAAELKPWLSLEGWDMFPAAANVRRDAGLALWELEPPAGPDEVTARLAAFAAADYVKLVIRSDSAYFGAGTEEVNAKDWVSDLWLARDGHASKLRMLISAKAGPYALYAALAGKPSWIAAAVKPAVRLGIFTAGSGQGDLLRPSCQDCGEVIPVGLLGEPSRLDRCPRCLDEVAGIVVAGLPRRSRV